MTMRHLINSVGRHSSTASATTQQKRESRRMGRRGQSQAGCSLLNPSASSSGAKKWHPRQGGGFASGRNTNWRERSMTIGRYCAMNSLTLWIGCPYIVQYTTCLGYSRFGRPSMFSALQAQCHFSRTKTNEAHCAQAA